MDLPSGNPNYPAVAKKLQKVDLSKTQILPILVCARKDLGQRSPGEAALRDVQGHVTAVDDPGDHG